MSVSARRQASYSTRSHRIVPNPFSPIPANPSSPIPNPCPCLYACLYRPPASDNVMVAIAEQFSPRYESHGVDLVSIDVSGLERLVGPAQTIGEELRREAAARGVRAQVAVAGTRMA